MRSSASVVVVISGVRHVLLVVWDDGEGGDGGHRGVFAEVRVHTFSRGISLHELVS